MKPPPVFLIKLIKIGAPIIAVRTDIGSSITETVLDKASISTIRLAPKDMLKGRVRVLLAPTIILAMWGIIKPIHPTCPHIDIDGPFVPTVANPTHGIPVFLRVS